MSFDFLGYTFRARALKNRHGQVFTGYGPAASSTAIAKMSTAITSWRLRSKTTWSWPDLVREIGPVIRGWMNYYGHYHRSALYPLLRRINYHLRRWLRAKYKRFRRRDSLDRAWDRVITQNPRALPHWQWITDAWR